MRNRLIRVAGWIVAGSLLVGADWQNCQRDLERLRSRAGEASDRAATTRAEGATMETKKRELDDCRASGRDGCRAPSDTYEGARKQFEAAKSNLDSTLDDVDSSVRATKSTPRCEPRIGRVTIRFRLPGLRHPPVIRSAGCSNGAKGTSRLNGSWRRARRSGRAKSSAESAFSERGASRNRCARLAPVRAPRGSQRSQWPSWRSTT